MKMAVFAPMHRRASNGCRREARSDEQTQRELQVKSVWSGIYRFFGLRFSGSKVQEFEGSNPEPELSLIPSLKPS